MVEVRGLRVEGHNAQGSTPSWMCKVRYWRWFFGNRIPIPLRG